MTEFDDKFRPLATKMLNKYGKTVIFGSMTDGTYDTVTGSVSRSASVTTVKARVRDYSPKEFRQGLIIVGDKEVSIAAEGIGTPKPGDTVTIDSSVYKVLASESVWSGEQVALYKLHCRL